MKKIGDIFILTDCYCRHETDKAVFHELDLGCGKGGFTRELSSKYPERRILAADVMIGRLRRLEKRIRASGISNIELLRIDAWNLIGYTLPDESVDRIHILCPDPWPKARHKQYRLLSSEFIGRMLRVLKRNGTVHFATDDRNYFESVEKLFSCNSSYRREDALISDIAVIRSDFEKKWEAEGAGVTHAAWRRVSGNMHRTKT
ncbi:MAG: methyltransferase domain-containing protein [Lentisphaerae bacterium]|nr:methyltransferase domain-containing protein [Lentisphaerota bacterium]